MARPAHLSSTLAPRGFLAALDRVFHLYREHVKTWWLIELLTLAPVLLVAMVMLNYSRMLGVIPRTGTTLDFISPFVVAMGLYDPKNWGEISPIGTAIEGILSIVQTTWLCAIVVLLWERKPATMRAGLRRVALRGWPLLFTQALLQAVVIGWFYALNVAQLIDNDVAQFFSLLLTAIVFVFASPWFYLLIPVCMAETHGPLRSFWRTVQLTRRNYWRLFWTTVVTEFLLWLAFLIPMLFMMYGLTEMMDNNNLRTVLAQGMLCLTCMAMAPVRGLLAASLYIEIRMRKEGWDIEQTLIQSASTLTTDLA